jgi:hypothetical protein
MNRSMRIRRKIGRVAAVAMLVGGIGLAVASPAWAGWQSGGLEDSLDQCETTGQMGLLYGEWLDYYCTGPVWHGTYRLWVLYP